MAAHFSLVVLVRDGDPQPQSARAVVAAGLLPLLRTALAAYQVLCPEGGFPSHARGFRDLLLILQGPEAGVNQRVVS